MTETEAIAHLGTCSACRRAYLGARRSVVDEGWAVDLRAHGQRQRVVLAVADARGPGDVDAVLLVRIVAALVEMHGGARCAAAR